MNIDLLRIRNIVERNRTYITDIDKLFSMVPDTGRLYHNLLNYHGNFIRDVVGVCLCKNVFFLAAATMLGITTDPTSVPDPFPDPTEPHPNTGSIVHHSSFVTNNAYKNSALKQKMLVNTLLLAEPSLLEYELTSGNSADLILKVNKRIQNKFKELIEYNAERQGVLYDSKKIVSTICKGENSIYAQFGNIWKIRSIDPTTETEITDLSFVFYFKFLQKYYMHIVEHYDAFGKELSYLIEKREISESEFVRSLYNEVENIIDIMGSKKITEKEWREFNTKIIEIATTIDYKKEKTELEEISARTVLMMCIRISIIPNLCVNIFRKERPWTWTPSPITAPRLIPMTLIQFLSEKEVKEVKLFNESEYYLNHLDPNEICYICQRPIHGTFPVLLHLASNYKFSHAVHPACLMQVELKSDLLYKCGKCSDILEISREQLKTYADKFPVPQTPASPAPPPPPLASPVSPVLPLSLSLPQGGKKKHTYRRRRSRKRTLDKKRKYKKYSYKNKKKNTGRRYVIL